VKCSHLHVNTHPITEDLNTVLPLGPLEQLAHEGRIGRRAEVHYSFMGYLLDTEQFLRESIPEIVNGLRQEEVDLALLVPV